MGWDGEMSSRYGVRCGYFRRRACGTWHAQSETVLGGSRVGGLGCHPGRWRACPGPRSGGIQAPGVMACGSGPQWRLLVQPQPLPQWPPRGAIPRRWL